MHELKTASDLDALIDDIGDRRVVMLGEASHGTHEYYTWRTALSQRLIREKGFSFIAVEGDWPDCYRVNRYLKAYEDGGDNVQEVLKTFDRWPTWMWANWEVAALAEWMRKYNDTLPPEQKVGFYGLDVYSLWDSMYEIVNYLEAEDPAAATAVKKAIECFQPFQDNEHRYAQFALGQHSCRDKVLALLKEIRNKVHHAEGDREASFSTEQNALVAVNAEKYYRSMMSFDNESWNVRDTHMMQTLDRLLQFHGSNSKAIVWEHNTHIGDARATDMKQAGMINIGQLAREKYGSSAVYLVGFGSYAGRVIAGEEWGAPMRVVDVPPAREGSIEHQLHKQSANNRYFLFSEPEIPEAFKDKVRHRAIGVVYNPANERFGNYVNSIMAKRYDAFVYLDETKALYPFGLPGKKGELPDLYPFGY